MRPRWGERKSHGQDSSRSWNKILQLNRPPYCPVILFSQVPRKAMAVQDLSYLSTGKIALGSRIFPSLLHNASMRALPGSSGSARSGLSTSVHSRDGLGWRSGGGSGRYAGRSHEELAGAMQTLSAAANQSPAAAGCVYHLSSQCPQYFIDIDREKAKTLQVPLSSIFCDATESARLSLCE